MNDEDLRPVTWKAYSMPHQGNSPEENEDAFSPEIQQQVFTMQAQLTCAVADGATQTSFSRAWARLLVQKAASMVPTYDLTELLSAAQADWKGMVSRINLPWHAEEKVRQGAFATLLWLGILDLQVPGYVSTSPFLPSNRLGRSGGSWKAVAVGDTCLFQFRKNEL
ncbi:MAG: hypothetical protein Q7U74_12290, partial [Saprospiraceae bacterium]|nr:hypothetical protein [Saprospiraceae bacterium]